MLKLPKGLKKKKKGKKSKRKGEEELFTEEELEKYRREQQHSALHSESGEASAKENEEWSKFKDLTTGIDSVLKKTQGDLDRIKSTSFFQRIPTGVKQPEPEVKEAFHRPVVEVTAADFPQLVQAAAAEADEADRSECGPTDDESEDEEQDDIFDTSYVEAVERGEVKLAYVPDSPEEFKDDDIFDTSHVDVLIKGQDAKSSKGKKGLDIGIAVEVLTGRIDNVTVTSKRPKRIIPGDLLLDNVEKELSTTPSTFTVEPEKSILDIDSDVPINTPIDLSASLHTSLIQQNKHGINTEAQEIKDEEDFDEFTKLAAESLESHTEVIKFDSKEIQVVPVIQEAWSAFEADKNDSVFAECIVEDQLDIVEPYLGQDDPFDTSFADAIVVPVAQSQSVIKEAVVLEEDDDFDPRAEEVQLRLNNRRKSSVRIHITDPSGLRESITSDDIIDKELSQVSRDLLGGSTTDLSILGDSPLDPIDLNNPDIDPFDTTIVDKIVAPGKVELKLLEQELIGVSPSSQIYRVPSDPDFDPRADENKKERRASRPENLTVSKSVVFNVEEGNVLDIDLKSKTIKPLTPYYTRELSITEDTNEDTEAVDTIPEKLTRTRSDEDIAQKVVHSTKRRYSEFSQSQSSRVKVGIKASDLFHSNQSSIPFKVLTPVLPETTEAEFVEDPFDTSFASNIAPSKTELKLLTKEFSCEDTNTSVTEGNSDLLEPSDDIFQIKALTPEPSDASRDTVENYDPFDTSFAGELNPGKTELKLLESEFLS
ncbi:hypothetical protein K1T71_008079 [Dendrolimus kikuchii]|uniref:Uncharacterized protein n=1 Tax=Dendrolimus kikuchii TaxID=765133 RepID=A0ACC1CW81_9NEOP|nr:hypothetical protein K1T71_008079 [Dendrolimus kikuchii]